VRGETPQIHAELITNLIDYGLDPQSSIVLPRFIWDLSNDEVLVEDGFNVDGLNEIKFRRVRYPSRLGVSAILSVNEGIKIRATDIRGDGLGIGIGFP